LLQDEENSGDLIKKKMKFGGKRNQGGVSALEKKRV
jgi:hypothetical protein